MADIQSNLTGRGGVLFSGGREMNIFSTVFQDFEKHMVGKSGFEIIINGISIFGHVLKKFFLLLTFVRLLEHFEDS